MSSIKFLGFAAGVVLAASSSVVAQTGPTYPTTPPITTAGGAGETTTGSGGSSDPRGPAEPGKPRTGTADGISTILPGTEPGAGR